MRVSLGGRLVRSGAVPASMGIVCHCQATKTCRQEGERIASAIGCVETAIGGAGGGSMISTRECGLCSGVGKRSSGMRRVGRAVSSIHLTHRRVCSGTATETRWQGVVAWGSCSKLLVETTETACGGSERSGCRCAGNGVRAHAKSTRGRIHRRRESRVSNNGSTRTRGTTAQAVDVLGEVVIATAFRTTLPVTSTERNHTTVTTHTTAVTHSMAMTTVHVRGDHGWRTIAIRTISNRFGSGGHSRERATEAGRTTLEVGETTRRASPVTGTRAVLRRRERGQDFGCTVQDPARRGGDLNGLFVEGTTVHA